MEKFKKAKSIAYVTIFLGVLFFMTSWCVAAPAVQKIVLKYGSYAPRVGHDEPLIWWADEVSRRSGVKIEYEFFWAEALAKAADCFDAIGAGAYDVGWLSPIFTPGKTPYMAIANSTPLTTSDLEVICAAHDELGRKGPGKAEFEKGNIKYLFAYGVWDYNLIGIKPIKTLEDVKGYRCRTFGYLAIPWKELGGVPISIPMPDVYNAFQSGLLDGALHQPVTFVKAKYYEYAKNFTYMGFGCLPGPFVMNMDKWNSLPPNVQKVMLEVSEEMPRHVLEITKRAEMAAIEELKQKGVKFYDLPASDRKRIKILAKKVWKEIGTSVDSKGLPGTKAVKLWTGLVKKYEAEKAKRK
jgi:TRAP-type C4-dicarboxylate transport system substrate-binding protein